MNGIRTSVESLIFFDFGSATVSDTDKWSMKKSTPVGYNSISNEREAINDWCCHLATHIDKFFYNENSDCGFIIQSHLRLTFDYVLKNTPEDCSNRQA